ncbi:alpha/beta fold hydrolase [Mycobacterium sp. CVI_P3]|uniref:Alpha/beta fold hydrolase n=1 Tax=Mycobacterium pinniadriaticum TaxID=2994102 RepID=A0ABT3SET2_9MYCO|nr:alpha/beta fold hydrolase [Mycobacterium pinniadriaticum]MCX2931582.1 alpha/beta fold hydrolase [Mycobacterium pinniadriaticum]MCX2938026.1 alpha/beta fold hydrolase [Mycobacterium pinniadriaticum]
MTSDQVPTRRVVPVGGIPMSGLFSEAANPRAVIVALHGGASSAAYYDCPGHPELSLLRCAAAAGFSAVALDRPGYGASAPYSEEMWEPSRRVELAYAAVDAILGKRDRGAGLFVMAHSNGCELALRMAVDERGRDLLGLELAGTGLRQYPSAAMILKQATPTYRPAGIRELIWAPEELYPADVVNAVGSAGAPPQEGQISANWAGRDFAALAGNVTVPVRFTAAEHERVWDSTPAALADIAALFTTSPRVELHHQPGAGHNLSLGVAAAQYHSSILSFVEQCITADVN